MKIKRILTIFSGIIVVFAFAFVANAATSIVYPGNENGWVFVDDNDNSVGSGTFVSGPATPPLGNGSARLFANVSSDREMLVLPQYQGTKLSDITKLEYSTYRVSGGPALAIALQFNIDTDLTDANTSWQSRLVYEPYYTHTVNTGVWQTWNTQDDSGTGNWWFAGAPQNAVCGIGNPCTWSELKAAFPNAGIHSTLGAILFKAGGGWTGFDGNVDAFTIGVNNVDNTYDFESSAPTPTPTPIVGPPTSKDECKKDGWKTFNNPTFKNQGQCVSYTNHN